MPRRDKQFRSKRSQFCWLHAGAGAAESSALASSRSSSVGGSSANTPIRPAHPTSEAEITKRRFEYKALSPKIGNHGPPCCLKTTPLWRDYVRSRGLFPVELAAVLNGRPLPPSLAAPWRLFAKLPERGNCREPAGGGVKAAIPIRAGTGRPRKRSHRVRSHRWRPPCGRRGTACGRPARRAGCWAWRSVRRGAVRARSSIHPDAG
jgi:hypothetical protein